MSIKVKAIERELMVGTNAGEYRYIMQADLYNKLSDAKVIQEAALRSGINKGAINAAWDAIGEVIKAWATEGHSVAVPGLGTMRFGVRATSVSDVNKVASSLITSRRVIFTPNVDIKDELKKTSISITCYDRNGNLVKRVTSLDDGDVEDNETDTPGEATGTENQGPGENQGQDSGNTPAPKKTVSLSVSPSGSGTVTGGGQYDSGSSVNIKATAASGYHFVKWSDNSTDANRTLNVLNSDITLQAIFAADAPQGGGDEGGGSGSGGGSEEENDPLNYGD